MNWYEIEGKWTRFNGSGRERWGRLTDNDWETITGRDDVMANSKRGATAARGGPRPKGMHPDTVARIKADYRSAFWRAARYALRKGQIDGLLGMAFISHHLIEFTREALRGDQNASYYSQKKRTAPMAVTKPPAAKETVAA